MDKSTSRLLIVYELFGGQRVSVLSPEVWDLSLFGMLLILFSLHYH